MALYLSKARVSTFNYPVYLPATVRAGDIGKPGILKGLKVDIKIRWPDPSFRPWRTLPRRRPELVEGMTNVWIPHQVRNDIKFSLNTHDSIRKASRIEHPESAGMRI